MAEDISAVTLDPDRAVMPIDLLHKVALIRQKRTTEPRRTRTHNVKVPYPLSVVAHCYRCDQQSETLAGRTATLQGYTTSSGARRYRHSAGMTCGCRKRSVLESVIDREFERILDNLIVKPEYMELMERIVLQEVSRFTEQPDAADLEQQKAEAIAQCRHRLERSRFLYMEGDISKEEYIHVRETNEQEIAHWQARTVHQQQVLIEMVTVLGTLTNLKRVWYDGTAEDKRGLVNAVFESLYFDLDTDRIVDFRLKPWADQYLVVCATMLVEQHGNEPQNFEDSEVDLMRLELMTSSMPLKRSPN